MAERLRVGILGATGTVGQRFIQMLDGHPFFEVAWLAASDRSTGRRYEDAVRWKLDTPIPAAVRPLPLLPATPDQPPSIIFAALDTDIAREIEPQFAAAGCAVISNSSAFRMQEDVPLVIPEVNAAHLGLIESQSWRKQSGGYIVTNPNCSAIGLVLALKPLADRFGIESIFVSTMQAISGAGYPGVPSLDILGNVVPFIKNEEEKMEAETHEAAGHAGRRGCPAVRRTHERALQPRCRRRRPHRERLHQAEHPRDARADAGRLERIQAACPHQLPTAPAQPVEFLTAEDRPQPRLDRMRGAGMAATVGRLRPCTLLDWKFTVLSHNTIRGAAGAALLNAELLMQLGKLSGTRTAHSVAAGAALSA